MLNILEARYHESKEAFLNELAYTNRSLEEYAEKRGGVAKLSQAEAKHYNGRRNALITIVHYQDTADAYINFLTDWINELMVQQRKLADEIKQTETGWMVHFPKMPNENEKEHRRWLSKHRAQLMQPNLY